MAISHYGDRRRIHHRAMTTLSVGDALAVNEHKDWLRSAGRSPKTIQDRIRLLTRLAAWLAAMPEPKTLGTATEDDLYDWQRSFSRKALETICAYVGHAQGYYRWLHQYKHQPDVSVLLVRPRLPRRLPRPIEDADLQGALRMADGAVLISLLLMAFCGLRVGEVARVQRHDMRDADAPPVLVVHGKGGRMRVVRLPAGLAAELRVIGIPARGYIVRAPSGERYSENRLSQVVNAWLHEHGMAATAHACRHWYGTHTYRVTGDIRLVQEMMGHASVNSTSIYTAYSPPHADQLADDLDVTMGAMLRPSVDPRQRLRIVPN